MNSKRLQTRTTKHESEISTQHSKTKCWKLEGKELNTRKQKCWKLEKKSRELLLAISVLFAHCVSISLYRFIKQGFHLSRSELFKAFFHRMVGNFVNKVDVAARGVFSMEHDTRCAVTLFPALIISSIALLSRFSVRKFSFRCLFFYFLAEYKRFFGSK